MSNVLEPARPSPTKPDFAGKLLLRIHSLRWHAAATASTSRHASTRMGAAAIVVHLDAMEVAAGDVRTEADLTAGDLQVDGLGVRFAALGPQYGGSMSEPREDDARRPHEGPQHQPNERPEPKREDPHGRPKEALEQKPLAEAEIDADDAQLLDPAAEPGKPI